MLNNPVLIASTSGAASALSVMTRNTHTKNSRAANTNVGMLSEFNEPPQQSVSAES